MKERTKSILIAMSFIVAMVLFIWGFNFLKGKSILRSQFEFHAVYDNTQGLLSGDVVSINGMAVGTVTSLRFNPNQDGSIIVTFIIDNDLNIPDNSVAKLTSSLMGSTSLCLELGDSKVFAQSGDTLVASYDAGTMGMIVEQITPLKDKVETVLVSLNDLAVNLNGMLNSELKEDLSKGVNSFASSMDNINVISSDLKDLVDSDNGRLTMAVNNLETITGNFVTVSDSLKKIDYIHLVSSLEGCIAEVNTLIEGINNGEGSAGLLVKNDSLYHNVNAAVVTLQSFVDEIKENPKKLKISVF